MRGVLLACLVVLLGGCGSDRTRVKSDWEQQNEGRLATEAAAEEVPELPPFPRRENLIEFFVSSASEFKFFIDRSSLAVKDGIVRYALVARSPSGADNISYEGMNCAAGAYRIYALGHSDGTWVSRPGPWREIPPRSVQRWHNALNREFFCPNRVAISDAAEGLMALKQGGHPWVKPDTAVGGAAR